MNGDALTDSEQRALAVATGLTTGSVRVPLQGRDNRVVIVNDRWVLRTPKTQESHKYMRNELAVLEQLSNTVGIPRPIGRYGDVVAYEFIPGVALDQQAWTSMESDDQSLVAGRLRSILEDLHQLPTVTLHGQTDLLDTSWVRNSIKACAGMEPRRSLNFDPASLLMRFEEAWQLGDAPTCIVHVDLKPPHLLINNNEVAIIDFGAVSVGDPALDYGVMTHYLGDDLIAALNIDDSGLVARARCYKDLYLLRMCTRGWTRTAPRWKNVHV